MSVVHRTTIVFGVLWLCILFTALYFAKKQNILNIEKIDSIENNSFEYLEKDKKLLQDIETQISFGPRYSGREGHERFVDWASKELLDLGFEITKQQWNFTQSDGNVLSFVNVIGRFAPEKTSRVILGAHYDSRAHADQDKVNPNEPVPGANDSASGVAVLLDVARTMSTQIERQLNVGVDIIFFDAEEGDPMLPNGKNAWKPYGSEYFAQHIFDFYGESLPESALIVDMVCDADLEFFVESDSYQLAKYNTSRLWTLGISLYPEVFTNKIGVSVHDDHTALNGIGIPSTLLIDFTYPYWHTIEDTVDKCSGENMKKVSNVVSEYVYSL